MCAHNTAREGCRVTNWRTSNVALQTQGFTSLVDQVRSQRSHDTTKHWDFRPPQSAGIPRQVEGRIVGCVAAWHEAEPLMGGSCRAVGGRKVTQGLDR